MKEHFSRERARHHACSSPTLATHHLLSLTLDERDVRVHFAQVGGPNLQLALTKAWRFVRWGIDCTWREYAVTQNIAVNTAKKYAEQLRSAGLLDWTLDGPAGLERVLFTIDFEALGQRQADSANVRKVLAHSAQMSFEDLCAPPIAAAMRPARTAEASPTPGLLHGDPGIFPSDRSRVADERSTRPGLSPSEAVHPRSTGPPIKSQGSSLTASNDTRTLTPSKPNKPAAPMGALGAAPTAPKNREAIAQAPLAMGALPREEVDGRDGQSQPGVANALMRLGIDIENAKLLARWYWNREPLRADTLLVAIGVSDCMADAHLEEKTDERIERVIRTNLDDARNGVQIDNLAGRVHSWLDSEEQKPSEFKPGGKPRMMARKAKMRAAQLRKRRVR